MDFYHKEKNDNHLKKLKLNMYGVPTWLEFIHIYKRQKNGNLIFTLWANLVLIFPNIPIRLGSRPNQVVNYVLWVLMGFKCYEKYLFFLLLMFGSLFIQISYIENHNETKEFTSTSQNCGPAFFTCIPTRSARLAFYLWKINVWKKSWSRHLFYFYFKGKIKQEIKP